MKIGRSETVLAKTSLLCAVCAFAVLFVAGCASTSSAVDPPNPPAAPATSAAAASPSSLTFQGQTVGVTSASQYVTLSNSGNATLNISSIAVTGTNPGDFTQSNNCGSSLAAAANCVISVNFTPQASGTRSASLTITDSASGSPQTITLTGIGDNATPVLVSLSPASANAGAAAQPLTTSGSGFLPSSTVTFNGISQAVTYLSSSQLSVGLTTDDQATAGDYAVVVTNPGPGGGSSNALYFQVGGVLINLSSSNLNFGYQAIQNTSAPQTFTISNNGNITLAISGITISGANAGDFAESDTCSAPVSAGGSCTVSITFDPSTVLPETATVSIWDNATNDPQLVTLGGTGVSATMNWSSVDQTIDGFGGAAVDAFAPLPSDLATFFFSQSSGIGLSIVRVQVIPDNATCTAWCNGTPGCACAQSSGATTTTGELAIAQQAQSFGVNTFFASSWSPPASMKTNDSWVAGGSFIGNTANYQSYASVLVSYVQFMSVNGINLFGISPQNEPDISQSYPSCLWTAQQFHDFAPYLSSALSTAGLSSVNVIIPENSAWSSSYDGFTSVAMTDPAVAPTIGLLAQHGYAGDSDIVAPVNYGYGQHVWVTEDSEQSATYDGSMSDALVWAQRIHSYLTTAQINAFVWWFLSDIPTDGDGTDNSALTDINGNIALRAYVTGNWSKFVRPGWQRVDVTNGGGLLITAFQSADTTQSAVVVVNATDNDVTQVFSVGTQMGSVVTPWVTSSSESLIAQPAVAVNAGLVTYTIPANSVVTFVGQAGN
jgi:O-glycosyl hydrolase